jgi:molybdopterin synthase sulfur carrier subunit
MITVLYFARFREKLGKERETLPLPAAGPASVQTLLDELAARGGIWQELLGCERGVLVAINQQMATRESALADGDEVAIFPPVTGG